MHKYELSMREQYYRGFWLKMMSARKETKKGVRPGERKLRFTKKT